MIKKLSRGKSGVAVFILLPMVLLGCYYYLFASDLYVSESVFIIREDKDSSNPLMEFGSFLGTSNTPSKNDALIIEEYIRSKDMMQFLDERIGLMRHYSGEENDYFSRINEFATTESFYSFYLDHIEVVVDDLSSVVTVTVKAFDPNFAQEVLLHIIKRSEEFVNEISRDLGAEQVGFIEGELERSKVQMRAATENIVKFQDVHEFLSPEIESATVSGVISALENQLALQRTELKRLQSFLNSGAAEVVSVKSSIRAIEQQLRQEQARLTGKGDRKLNDVMVEYQNLQLELKFATDIYLSNVASLESARLDASKKVKHLVRISQPNLPQQALYPKRSYILATVFAILVLLYGIGQLTVATIKEHRD